MCFREEELILDVTKCEKDDDAGQQGFKETSACNVDECVVEVVVTTEDPQDLVTIPDPDTFMDGNMDENMDVEKMMAEYEDVESGSAAEEVDVEEVVEIEEVEVEEAEIEGEVTVTEESKIEEPKIEESAEKSENPPKTTESPKSLETTLSSNSTDPSTTQTNATNSIETSSTPPTVPSKVLI